MDIYAHEPLGFEGVLVHVEADIRNGIPAVEIVGLASTAVREARERARIAVRNAGFTFPQDRILVNLSPADLPKEGAAYDLPIALKILATSGQIEDLPFQLLAMGELTLGGEIKPTRGILPAVRSAADHGIRICILPHENAAEARIVSSVQVWPVRHLSELRKTFAAFKKGEAPPKNDNVTEDYTLEPIQDFSDFRGDDRLMRALVVAAAGRHNMFLAGPPGAGKTMAAQRFPSILPELDMGEALEVASLYSLWGKNQGELMRRPPFRAPHHSASLEGMLGGSRPLRPGEVSLAHHGVLFLDECPEFHRDVLQALREPVEYGYVEIVRAGRVIRFPSDFQLVMAANPCPCGNLGMPGKTCLCSAEEIRRYWKKLGGALLDRIDMRIAVSPPEPSRLISTTPVSTEVLREKVRSARLHQRARLEAYLKQSCSEQEKIHMNARIPPALIPEVCAVHGAAERLFLSGMASYGLSARAGHSILRVARTIADLDARAEIGESSIEEAMEYRQFGDDDAIWPS